MLHVYTESSGSRRCLAKGVRRTKSRFGGRLEPFSHVELSIHRGPASSAPSPARRSSARTTGFAPTATASRSGSSVEAMLRLFTEEKRNDRAFLALTRFLDSLDEREPRPGVSSCSRAARALVPAETALAVRLPPTPWKLRGVRSREGTGRLPPRAGGAVCEGCDRGGIALSADGLGGWLTLGDADRGRPGRRLDRSRGA